jgi:UDP-glucose 4-epimerase
MQKTIIVAGAYGFCGRHVARLCAQQGFVVIGLGHGKWSREDWKLWGLSEWHEGDVTLDTLKQTEKEPHAILHFAGSGSVPLSLTDPWMDFRRTVITTADVLEYVRSKSPSTRVVYPSSASVYGSAETSPIREDCRPLPVSPYGIHKAIAEQLVISYSKNFDVSSAIIRYFSIYGEGLRKQLLWEACRKFCQDDPIFMGTGDEVRDWLHISDASALAILAIEKSSTKCPIVNGGTGEGVRVRDLLQKLSQSLPCSKADPKFSGTSRRGDPTSYVADVSLVRTWGWTPKQDWQRKICDYADWWQGEHAHIARKIALTVNSSDASQDRDKE